MPSIEPRDLERSRSLAAERGRARSHVSGDVLQQVLLHGGRLAAIGPVLGLAIALALTHLMRAHLPGISAADPLTLGLVSAVIAATTLLACWLPARRAAGVDPTVALRHE